MVFKSNRIWNKPTVSFKINFQIQIEQESEIHFCNENYLQKQLGLHGPPYTILVLDYKKQDNCKIFNSSAILIASDSDIDEAFKSMH